MTDDERTNIALAKWMGYEDIRNVATKGETPIIKAISPGREWFCTIPSYTTDLNAVAKIEAKLTDEQWPLYVHALTIEVSVRDSSAYNRKLFCATAAQKCQALVRALGAR